jgi:TPR repeat protein
MKITASVFVLLFVFSGFAQSQSPTSEGKPILGVADLVLRSDEVAKLSDEAWAGSGEAALKLSVYYANVKVDFDRSSYWTLIAAENGNAVAQYNAWAELSDSRSSADDKRRAVFWLRKSAVQGDSDAIRELRELERSQGE